MNAPHLFTRRHAKGLVTLAAIVALAGPVVAQQAIPAHPDDLVFGELEFEPPDPATLRHELPNGVVVFVVEDHELPLVNISVLMRTGDYTEPALAVPGLAGLTGSQMRNGGTAALTPSELDEELDFLAAFMGTGIGSTSGNGNLNCLTKDLDSCLDLLLEILREPRFDQQRLELAKSQLLQSMQRRNDSTPRIETREWARLLRGTTHFSTVATTEAGITALTSEDLRAFHGYAVHPGNFVFAISGDVDGAEILAKIEAHLADWAAGEPSGQVPVPDWEPQPGLYLVHKEDVNQGRISMGHLGTTRENPDRYALMIMNHILGGGAFTSRVTSRVRSDEGLAYSAGCQYSFGTYYDGTFRCFFQSRSEAVARAGAIVIEEIERIRTDEVSEEELATAKASFIETFSRNFASARQVAGLFANLELTDRDPDYIKSYRDNVAAVTAEDVLRVAQQYLHPDQLLILAVGNVDDMLAGDSEYPDFSLTALAPGGNVTRIPLPDPMTMEYPSE